MASLTTSIVRGCCTYSSLSGQHSDSSTLQILLLRPWKISPSLKPFLSSLAHTCRGKDMDQTFRPSPAIYLQTPASHQRFLTQVGREEAADKVQSP